MQAFKQVFELTCKVETEWVKQVKLRLNGLGNLFFLLAFKT